MENNKMSFTEIVSNFEQKFGQEWCNNKSITEVVSDTFIDYLKSLPEDQFNYEKVNNFKS